MCARLWDDLGLDGIRLEINSLGQSEERARHRADLVAYLEQRQDLLDEDARRRLHSNPLRILDTKNPVLQELVEARAKADRLSRGGIPRHFEGVQQLLKDAAIPYRINPRLVRGLDYYNLTVFEWMTDQLGCAGHGMRRRSL
jgi:histidyl-tRNA synthetase